MTQEKPIDPYYQQRYQDAYQDAFTSAYTAFVARAIDEDTCASLSDAHSPTKADTQQENTVILRTLQRTAKEQLLETLDARIQDILNGRVSSHARDYESGDIALDAPTRTTTAPPPPRTITLQIKATKYAYSMDILDTATGASIENVSNIDVVIKMRAGRSYATAVVTIEQPLLDLQNIRGVLVSDAAYPDTDMQDLTDTQDMSGFTR